MDAFLEGCTDKKAALLAVDKNPVTLDQVLKFVKSSIHNQRILLGYRVKSESVKRVQFESEDDSDTEQSQLALMVLNRKPDYSS